MKQIKHLVVISTNYPCPAKPTYGTFVQQITHSFARNGLNCTVLQPIPFHKVWKRKQYPYHNIETVQGGKVVHVYRPSYFSVSSRDGFQRLGPLNPCIWNLWFFAQAIVRCMKSEKFTADAFYGHFMYPSGVTACKIAKSIDRPAFPCVGEGEFWTVRKYGEKHARRFMRNATGILANSSELKCKLVNELQQDPEKIGVFPNGTDFTRFKAKDRAQARTQLGLPEDQFLICSVGNFLYKKGISRVGEAIQGLKDVHGVFIGSGPDAPKNDNIAFCGRVAHDKLPLYLSAADVFVLPTMIEGSCNAIVEAMACGLPIISSKGPFNDDLLSPEMSIRIDPLNIGEIRAAILKLRDDPDLRQSMAQACLERSKQFDVNDRAKKIIAFMEQRM